MSFKGKVVLITGASRGIGRVTALTFAGRGASVVINYLRSEGAARDVVRKIEWAGGSAMLARADVSNAQEVTQMVQRVLDRYDKIDVLVNNAAIIERTPFFETTISEWSRVLDVDLKGVFICSREVARNMVERRYGRIVNVTSVGGITGHPGVGVHYAAAKTGIIGLTRRLAREFAPYNITANAVAPSVVDTEMFVSSTVKREDIVKTTPLGRIGKPEDIANAIAFFASDEAEYITGQILYVDGGRSLCV